jgi:hypothetical protein
VLRAKALITKPSIYVKVHELSIVDRINDVLKHKKNNLLVIYFTKLLYVIYFIVFFLIFFELKKTPIFDHVYLQQREIGGPRYIISYWNG